MKAIPYTATFSIKSSLTECTCSCRHLHKKSSFTTQGERVPYSAHKAVKATLNEQQFPLGSYLAVKVCYLSIWLS